MSLVRLRLPMERLNHKVIIVEMIVKEEMMIVTNEMMMILNEVMTIVSEMMLSRGR